MNKSGFKIDFLQALDVSFFRRKPEIVAKELLGKIIVKKDRDIWLAAKIVEVEAYLSKGDLSCHAATGKTLRNAPMFEPGGVLYVYKIYGVHHCINFVTEDEGKGSAVLIRACEPLLGIDKMKQNRNVQITKTKKVETKNTNTIIKLPELCKGPGNLAKAFGFTRKDNYRNLKSPDFFIQKNDFPKNADISVSKRIGITKSADLMLRYFFEDSLYVSGKNNNK